MIALCSGVALISLVAKLAAGVFIAYKISTHGRLTLRGMATYVLVVLGVMACFDGFTLAYREDNRARYGRVTSGVILEKFSSTEAQGSRYIGRRGGRDQVRRRPIVTITGFRFHEVLARLIATGSPAAWVISYRFSCDAPRGCSERDFVSEELWMRLRAGQPVNVRQVKGESMTARLDEYPQWNFAAADIALGAGLLFVAGLMSGRIGVFRARRWVTAPAVVMAVEPVRYGEDPRWRVRFAYFDREGVAQESADEVGSRPWKVGDSCIAVFQPTRPDLATLRPCRETATSSISA
jgi:hypothetical protein